MRSGLVVLVAAAGCSQWFDLDSPVLHDASSGGSTVTGRFVLEYPRNNEQYEAVVAEYLPTLTSVEARLANGTSLPVSSTAGNTYEFTTPVAGEPYTVRFIGNEMVPFELQHHASNFEVELYSSVRPKETVAGAGTELLYEITDMLPPGSSLAVFSTGQWMMAPASQEMSNEYRVKWATASATASPPMLLKSSQFDRAYLVVLTVSNGLQSVERYRVDDVEMTSGTVHRIMGPTMPVLRTSCMRVELPMGAEANRQATVGLADPAPIGVWYMHSVPREDVVVNPAPLIGSVGLPLPLDYAADVAYGNPYPGIPVLQMAVVRQRKVSLANGVIDIPVGTSYLMAAQPNCTMPTTIVPDIAIPMAMVFGGHALSIDGAEVTLDLTKPAELTWQRRGNGRSDRAFVFLQEVTPSQTLTTVMMFATVDNRVRVDPSLLKPGGTYLFQVIEQTGFTGAASGDMSFAMPAGSAFNFSSAFTVN
jgi:hypothetical protein